MRNIRIALYVCLAGLLATACQKDKIEEQLPLREYTTDIFKLKSAPFVDDNNGQKVYLQYTDMSSTLFYEDGDKIRIGSDLGGYGDFVIKYRTVSDGQSPAVTSDGWYAQGSAELTGNTFYAAYVDGFNDNSANLQGEGPSSFAFNINSIKEDVNYNKVILSGNTSSSTNGTMLTLEPACAILRLNTQGAGATYSYVKVGFEATKVPKKGTVNASSRTLSVSGVNDYLTGVAQSGAGEFLYMRRSNVSAGEDDYWYVAIPIIGSSVSTTLYLEWQKGGVTTQYKTSGEVTLEKGRVYTVGTTRSTPFTTEGYTKSFFYVNGSGGAVAFSAGNLQGQRHRQGMGQVNEWKFAPSQMTALVDANASIGLGVWVDLLGYGTSGNTAHPNLSETNVSYYPSGDIAGSADDWGVFNSTSPGIIYGSTTVTDISWSTLTKLEWEYLIGRSNKAGLATITIDAIAYEGLVLLPDETESGTPWSMPDGVSFNASFSSYTANSYSASEWSTLENSGAVFLPVTNYRNGKTVTGNHEGYYWTSTGNGAASYVLKITSSSVSVVSATRSRGCAVRLVARAE